MFPPKTVSEILGIPPSSLRRYCSAWSQYLSESAQTTGKKRQFTQEDIDALRIIRDLVGKKSHAEIVAALQEPEPLTGEVFEDFQPDQEPEQPSAIQSIEFFSQVIDQMADQHKSVIMAKDETITGLKKDKDRLQNELSWHRLAWYRRIFKNPPE